MHHGQVGFIPSSQDSSAYTNQCDTQRKQKTTDTRIISVGAEKASDKIQHPFMINLTTVEYRRNISQDNTSYSWQIYSQYNSGKKLKD